MPCFFNGCKKKSYCANHSSDNHIRHPVDRYQCSVFVPYFDLNDVGTFPLMDKSTLSDDISSLCLFHPVVIKCEYYFGTRCWWMFLIFGILGIIAALYVRQVLWSSLLGVFAFSSFWTILEIFEQKGRVKKGWFPMNPKRKKEYES